ncbi:MAG: DUF2157 domain-containing protein [Pseudomonadota bacterium]
MEKPHGGISGAAQVGCMSARASVFEAVARGWIAVDDAGRALAHAGGIITADEWRRFGRAFLLGCGLLALALGLAFFVAWNWADLHRFAKLGLVASCLVLALGARLCARRGSVLATALVPVQLLLIGVLLALTGQIYQSGADRWELFALWAVIALPLVASERSFFGWLPWLGLVNMAAMLWADTRPLGLSFLWTDSLALYWVLAAINGVAGVLAARGVLVCERDSWASVLARMALVGAGACLTVVAVAAVFSNNQYIAASFAGWVGFLALLWYRYRRVEIDLPLMAGFALSICIVVFAIALRLAAEVSNDFSLGHALLLALFILALATVAGRWLLGLQREGES